jgi:prephenate dehydratase
MSMRIAYQGEPGAFSEAAVQLVKPDAVATSFRSFEQVFDAVARGVVSHGIVPIENSIGGSIHRNYDLLLEHELPIVGEVELKVEHALLALPGVGLDDIKRVYSHPQALAQCERFLESLAGVEVIATYDTAGSGKMIREGGVKDAAAIASARAAELFDLAILKSGIQDFASNITRFLLISRRPVPLGTPDKTSIVVSIGNEPGALFKALSVFALRDIDLTKLESRPIRGRPWEYLFYIDLGIAREELRCARALVHLGEFARSLRTLGTYERWKNPSNEAGAPPPPPTPPPAPPA